MSGVYLGGRGRGGQLTAAAAAPLRAPLLASSAAALATLAAQLGGALAVRLLFSKAYVQLVKGFGTSEERRALARSWLGRLGVPLDATLADLRQLLCTPCGFVLFCAETQSPRLFHGASADGDLALVALVAALCSLMPVQSAAERSLLDAELFLPFEVLASLLQPKPLLLLGPAEAPPPRFPGVHFSALVWSFSDRMFARQATSLPTFRLPLEDCGGAPVAAVLLAFFVACVLERVTAQRRPAPRQPALPAACSSPP